MVLEIWYWLQLTINIPKKSSYKPKAIESEGTVDSITTNEINEFFNDVLRLSTKDSQSLLCEYGY